MVVITVPLIRVNIAIIIITGLKNNTKRMEISPQGIVIRAGKRDISLWTALLNVRRVERKATRHVNVTKTRTTKPRKGRVNLLPHLLFPSLNLTAEHP